MRSRFGSLLVTALLLFPTFLMAETEMNVDLTSSKINWIGRKLTGQHNGTVTLKNGKVVFNGDEIVGGNFDVDLNSITVLDIKDQKDNQKLTNHLKSDDFFSSTAFPVASFKITKAEKIAPPGVDGANWNITGELSIKGIIQPVTFPAKIEKTPDNTSTAKATFNLDRTLWNIRYGSGKFFENLGDKIIYDEFQVSLDLVAKVMVAKAMLPKP